MSQLDKISLFSSLLGEKELHNLNDEKDVKVSSAEALALLAVLSYYERKRKMFFLFPTIYEAERFIQFIGDYLPDEETFIFPYDEIFRTSAIGVSPEMSEERLLAMSSIISDKPSILVSHISASRVHIMPKERYQKNMLSLANGDMLIVSDFAKKLSSLGYISVDKVTAINQFALRGGILDIYDASYSDPVRIEFFGDEIDDIRFFHVNDEMSYEHAKNVLIHPASLMLLESEEINKGISSINDAIVASSESEHKDRLSYDDLVERMNSLILSAQSGYLQDIDSRFYSLFHEEDFSLLDCIDGYESYLFSPEDSFDCYDAVIEKEKKYFRKSIKDGNSIQGERIFVNQKPDFSSFHTASITDDSFVLRANSYHSISYAESDKMIRQYLEDGYSVRLIISEPNYSNYINYMSEQQLSFTQYPTISNLTILDNKISHGFELPTKKEVYLSQKEIYGVSNTRSRFLSRYKEAKIIRKYEDLEVGDYVVHEVHGVGKYLGVDTLDGLEYLKIQYAGEALFYLPLSQYRLIRKYSSREGFAPALDKMGGSTWSRKKSKIRSRISYLADQLLAIYSERRTRPGYAFPRDNELENEFFASFSHQYTESQEEAIRDIRDDMESSSPMDRLVAGDVGFGKTEMAFYAAFKAILVNKQAVLLCPTTILSMQHYKVAVNRFEKFGTRIALYNRFVPENERKEILAKLEKGEIDLVIGTHSLLSDSVKFHDLGVLIIDEEQKFGVAHKEKIKEKAKNIDCLTLTATPIPRTMQMSLLGVRALSLLSKPPVDRMPVKTYVAKQDDDLIEEVIQKELDRCGQVYYLHNKISDIDTLANKLRKKFRGKNIGVAHAKMSQDDIEEIMDKFYGGDIDILVCTSIIESGLDIPNVNTIIVEGADKFGLAQLYQIKGRVGRSSRLAYAYFFFKNDNMTDEARKRLKALKDFTELGSGYKIAMQDLNIRGAGDILGSEQAGFVDTLGYDAYIELLSQVVKEKSLSESAVDDKPKTDFELSFSLDAHIPEDYGSEGQRITMYRELSDCHNDKDLRAFAEKIRDVYGPYPEEVANLLVKRKIEIHLNSGDYSGFIEGLGVYQITTSKEFSSKPQVYKKLEELMRPLDVRIRAKVTNDHRFEFYLTKTKDYLADLSYFTEELSKL